MMLLSILYADTTLFFTLKIVSLVFLASEEKVKLNIATIHIRNIAKKLFFFFLKCNCIKIKLNLNQKIYNTKVIYIILIKKKVNNITNLYLYIIW